MRRLEVFFDVSSPWTYLAFTRLPALAAEAGVPITWRPILVGGVFNAVNQEVYERRANPDPRKAAYAAKDLQDWARFTGLRIGRPPVFPVRAVLPMRAVTAAAEREAVVPLARALFEAYWGDLEDISQPQAVAAAARRAGLDPDWLAARAEAPDIKERLRATTGELVARGGFGSPTMFVDGSDMYFGNDRLPLVAAALARS